MIHVKVVSQNSTYVLTPKDDIDIVYASTIESAMRLVKRARGERQVILNAERIQEF